jgi:holin-like protein
MERVAAEWLPILAALMVSAMVSLVVTAYTLRWLQK